MSDNVFNIVRVFISTLVIAIIVSQWIYNYPASSVVVWVVAILVTLLALCALALVWTVDRWV